MYALASAVWIKGSKPTQKEQEFIDHVGALTVLNAKYFRPTVSDRVNAARIYNLSGNEEIDKFYDDVLAKETITINPRITEEEDEEAAKVPVEVVVEEGYENKPVKHTKRGRPSKSYE